MGVFSWFDFGVVFEWRVTVAWGSAIPSSVNSVRRRAHVVLIPKIFPRFVHLPYFWTSIVIIIMCVYSNAYKSYSSIFVIQSFTRIYFIYNYIRFEHSCFGDRVDFICIKNSLVILISFTSAKVTFVPQFEYYNSALSNNSVTAYVLGRFTVHLLE